MVYGGFWRRVAAALIDGALTWAAAYLLMAILRLDPKSAESAITLLFNWLYHTVLESSSTQATVGKMALGLMVTDLDGHRISFGRANGRYWGQIISALILGIGYLMVAFSQKKQGLHDRMAKTLVIRKRA